MAKTAGNYSNARLTEVLYKAMIGVSDNIFTTRPTAIPTSVNDFIVVEFPNAIQDNLGIGYTGARVTCFAKELSQNGYLIENIVKLRSMQDAVYAKLPIRDAICLIDRPIPVKLGRDATGFHALAINLNVTIL